MLAGALGGPAASPALGHGDAYLWWDEGGSAFKHVIGANQAVSIYAGKIDYLCDFLYPTADVYIVRGVPELGDELVDVSGVPNTIQGATGGLFIEELIGVTVPSGRLAVGTYTVVYDECQDGIVDVFDSVFASALRVDVPTDLPPIDPSIQLLKANSSYLEATWQQVEAEFAMIELAAKLKIIADCIKVGIGGCSAKMAMDLAMKAYLEYIRLAVGAVDPKKAFKDYVKDVQSHYRGIAADPPDPAFDQLAVPIVPPILEAETIDALDAAWLRLGSEAAVEGAIAQALLHALERYQGADAAAEGTGGIQQAEQMRAMAIGLSEQLLRTDAALASLAVVLGTDSDVLDDVAAAAGPELERLVVEGFTADQIRDLRNAGLEPAEIDDLLASLTSEPSLTDLSSAAVLAHIAAHRSGIVETRTGLADLVADLDGRIAALADEPGIMPGLPTADAGGPYGASEGVAVTLDGSGSSDADGALAALDWDLDADGDFDDAAGAGPSATFTGAGTHVVNLRVTDGEGNIDVDTAFVIVGDTRHQPSILTWSPASDRPQVIVGATAGFSMAADDPDGDPVALTWGVDGVPSGSGPSLEFGPATTDEIGFHWISGTASDGAAGGGRSSRDWILQVLAADDDADGWRSNTDCDDADGSVNPDQAEVVLNGKDDDCDPGTSDDGLGPTAAFVSSAPSGGRNVALYDTGPFNGSPSPTSATPMAQSNPWNSQWGLSAAMDFPTGNPAWITTNGGYGVIRLSNNATWLIDRVAVMPTIDLQFRPTRVRDFAVDVSTTGFASESDWSTVLTATAADAATLQSFSVPGGPVAARYVRIRLLSNRGDSVWTSMEQIRLYTPQQSGGSTFDFDDRSTDPDQDIASRLWDFGDGATSTDVDPSHTFAGPGSYPITLTVTDSRGHSATTTLVHRVLAGPTVSFPPKGPINERNAIYGDGYAATDPDGDPVVQLSWDWGDGSPSATQWTSTWQVHNYAQDGTYTIRLTATDAQEQTGTFERQLVVLNVPPTASLSNRSVIGGLPFTYSANPFDAADPITCEWDWGDGSTVTAGCGPQAHVYPSPGAGAPDATYTQTFRVTDDDITVTKTATITVAAKLASRLVADGLTFTFDPPASIGDVTGSKTCTWDFGDGSASVTGCGSQRHAYPAMTPGAADAPHALTLQVTAGGQTATLAGTVTTRTVGHPPVYHADFEGTLGSEWSGVTATEPIQGYVGYGFDGKLLRNATGGNATTLTLTGLPQHTSVDLRFFLAIIDSWDGCVGPGPDTLTIRVDGVALLSEVFENSGCGTQSYVPPPDVTLARHANFGFVGDFGYFRDSAYAMGFDPRFSAIPHTASTLTLEWSYNRQGANDESFGIDNLDVVLNGVPDLNDAPGAEAGGPYAVAEGSTLVLDGSGSADPDGDSLTYAWDLDADGEFDDATGANASITPDDGPASMTVRLRVTDPSGESSTDDATVSVSNVAPTAVLVTPANVAEGGAFNVELGDANDPSSADLAGLTFAFDCGLGGGYGAFTSAMSTACTAGDDDVDAAVRATVRDKDGGVTEYAATVPVFNAPPSGTFGATSPILEGGTSTLTWTGESDPSSSDAAALRHSFACDGLIVSLVDSWIAASVAASTTCSFDDNGSYVVRGRVLDPDNDSESRTAPVFVENVPPSATLATPAIVAEGSSFPISLSDPVDPSAADTAAGFTYAFDCGDGAGFGPFSSSAGATCTASNDGAANVAAM
ncbi:MAG: PKD domain-containing protein, partial [Chloroflexota bacterium]